MKRHIELTERAAGDTKFSRLYRAHAGFVRRRLAAARIPPSARDDVAQDVWLTVFRRIDDIREEDGPRGWIAQVIRNHLQHRSRSFARRMRKEDAYAAVEKLPDDPHLRIDAAVTLERLLEQLNREQREVVVESELMGRTVPELAATSGLPTNTIYSRLRLARSRLSRLALALAAALVTGAEALRRGLWWQSARLSAGEASTGGSFAHSAALTAIVSSVFVSVPRHDPALRQIAPVRDTASTADHASPVLSTLQLASDDWHDLAARLRLVMAPSPTVPAAEVASEDPVLDPAALRRRREKRPPRQRRTPTLQKKPQEDKDDPALLRRAQAKLRAGSLREALRLAEAHRRRFPASDLRLARATLMIDALCGLDRPTAARRIFRLTFAERDDAALSQRSREGMCW